MEISFIRQIFLTLISLDATANPFLFFSGPFQPGQMYQLERSAPLMARF